MPKPRCAGPAKPATHLYSSPRGPGSGSTNFAWTKWSSDQLVIKCDSGKIGQVSGAELLFQDRATVGEGLV